MSVVILVPVMNRPQRAAPLVESIRATSDSLVVFLVGASDRRERHAIHRVIERFAFVEEVVVPFQQLPGDYARKINHGVDITTEEWIFQGADDLCFHDGWLPAALAIAESSERRVIGTNDLCNPRVIRGAHSTHSLVHRSYVDEVGTVDEPGKLLHDGYFHNFCDDELVTTALFRGEFISAKASHVEHLHPNCGGAVMDATYERGLNTVEFTADRHRFNDRRAGVFGKRPVAGRHARR